MTLVANTTHATPMMVAIASVALATSPNATTLLCLLNIATKIPLLQRFRAVVLAGKPCSEMFAAFKMSDLGLLHYYLGIEVKQGPKGTSLS